jgi:hypothetical protein
MHHFLDEPDAFDGKPVFLPDQSMVIVSIWI